MGLCLNAIWHNLKYNNYRRQQHTLYCRNHLYYKHLYNISDKSGALCWLLRCKHVAEIVSATALQIL